MCCHVSKDIPGPVFGLSLDFEARHSICPGDKKKTANERPFPAIQPRMRQDSGNLTIIFVVSVYTSYGAFYLRQMVLLNPQKRGPERKISYSLSRRNYFRCRRTAIQLDAMPSRTPIRINIKNILPKFDTK